jgi:hypothetical protein
MQDTTSGSPIARIPSAGATRNICLSPSQAGLAKTLLVSVNESHEVHLEAQAKWEAFLIGAGMIQGDRITGGDLDSDDPTKRCLTVESSNGLSGG